MTEAKQCQVCNNSQSIAAGRWCRACGIGRTASGQLVDVFFHMAKHIQAEEPFKGTQPMPLADKLKLMVYDAGDHFILEMPGDEAFLYHEGKAMRHCLQTCYAEYADRIRNGSQRQFSVVDKATGLPYVNFEVAVTSSSYGGPVEDPCVTQIRGHANQCPPDDRFIPTIVNFCKEQGFKLKHATRNFDGAVDGVKVHRRYVTLMAMKQATQAS